MTITRTIYNGRMLLFRELILPFCTRTTPLRGKFPGTNAPTNQPGQTPRAKPLGKRPIPVEVPGQTLLALPHTNLNR